MYGTTSTFISKGETVLDDLNNKKSDFCLFSRNTCIPFNRVIALIFLAFVAALAIFALSGCRYSETLFQIKTDQLSGEYEPRSNPEFKDTEGAPDDPTRESMHLSDSDNLAAQVNMRPVYSSNAGSNGFADKSTYDETTNDVQEAETGTESSDEEGEASVTDKSSETDNGSGESDEGEKQSGDEGENQADKTEGRGGKGQTYGDGTYDELPAARAIAAKGTYALITQMLGGKGALAATDSQWVKDMTATGAFTDEGIDYIETVWTGNNGNTLDTDALIDTHADAVLVDGVDCTLTEKQTKVLKDAGINIVTVPALGTPDTADKDIATAIKVVAQILSGSEAEVTYDTAAMADIWQQAHDEVIENCISSNGGYSYKVIGGATYEGIYQGNKDIGESTSRLSDTRIVTAYIDEMRTASKSDVTADRSWGGIPLYLDGEKLDVSNGVGVSPCINAGNFMLMDYYLQTAGVVNNSYDGSKPTDISLTGLTLPYAVIAGNANGVLSSVGSRSNSNALCLPLYGTASWTCVGDTEFPGILVRDESIAESVSRSASKKNGLYNVGQPYYIQVVPEGIAGSWVDGTPESYLLAPWSFEVFQNGSLSESAAYIDDYYSCFYRIENATLNSIKNYNTRKEAACPTR